MNVCLTKRKRDGGIFETHPKAAIYTLMAVTFVGVLLLSLLGVVPPARGSELPAGQTSVHSATAGSPPPDRMVVEGVDYLASDAAVTTGRDDHKLQWFSERRYCHVLTGAAAARLDARMGRLGAAPVSNEQLPAGGYVLLFANTRTGYAEVWTAQNTETLGTVACLAAVSPMGESF